MVVQALLFLGKRSVSDKIIRRIRQALSPGDRKRLLKDAKYTYDWVADVARRIAGVQYNG